MGVTLIIAEKPSVCRDIANVIGANVKKEGCYVGNGYIVTHCVGHLVTLSEPDEYGEEFNGDWKGCFNSLPIIPDHFKTKVIPGVKTQFDFVKKLMNNDNVSEIVVGTDAGREGQFIYGLLAEKVKCHKPEKRLWISSMTEEAIKTGMKNLKNNRDYDGLLESAYCRAKADWLVGMNFTRLYTVLYNAYPPLSIGRVQTPTLALIVNRQKEIESFISTPFWEVEIKAGDITGKWYNKSISRFTDKSKAEYIVSKVKNKSAIVTTYEVSQKSTERPKLYDLNEIQKDANDIYGYTLSDVLDSVQRLYEHYKVATYPRTDSRYLTDDMKPLIQDRLKSLCTIDKYRQISQNLLNNGYIMDKLIFDNSKVSDHHAIIVTENIENFSFDQIINEIKNRGGDSNIKLAKSLEKYKEIDSNVLHLIISRLLISLSPKMLYNETNIVLTAEEETFYAKYKEITNKGFKQVQELLLKNSLQEDDFVPREQNSIKLTKGKGMSLKIDDTNILEKKTTPPKYYTDKTIISAMQNPSSQVDEEELKEAVKGYELGTTATRSEIINTLLKREYIKREKKNLIATEKGIKLIQILPDKLKSPELTAEWEYSLSKIEKGELSSTTFMNSIINDIKTLFDKVKLQSTDEETFKNTNKNVIGKCPICGADVIETSKAYGCSEWQNGCKFTIWKDDKRIICYTDKKPTKANIISLLNKGYFTVKKDGKYGQYSIKLTLEIVDGKEKFSVKK